MLKIRKISFFFLQDVGEDVLLFLFLTFQRGSTNGLPAVAQDSASNIPAVGLDSTNSLQ